MHNNISFIIGDENILDEIKDLWEELNKYHLKKSIHFKNFYNSFTFEMRKEKLNSSNEKILFVLIAKINDDKIGYSIASVLNDIGEIDSIYVKSEYRGNKIGKILIEKTLDWIKSKEAKKVIVNISVGNEDVFDFYSYYEFLPRLTQLEMNFKD